MDHHTIYMQYIISIYRINHHISPETRGWGLSRGHENPPTAMAQTPAVLRCENHPSLPTEKNSLQRSAPKIDKLVQHGYKK